jgi:hypothetical protein
MALHLSARVAWHMNGWDGRICRDPASNTYCVGPASYPFGFISEARDLDWEQANAGRCCMELGRMPPCMYSVNAFGPHELSAHADPPDCFGKGSRRRSWTLPASTVCVWPYDGMYNAEGVRSGDGFAYDERLERAREFWSRIEPDRSLIVYYANHSNPFSEEDARRYVIVGMSRVKAVGEIMFYEGCSESVPQKYGGGFVWQLPVTSHYPDQGVRLPYHLYLDQPDLLEVPGVLRDAEESRQERVCFFRRKTAPSDHISRASLRAGSPGRFDPIRPRERSASRPCCSRCR